MFSLQDSNYDIHAYGAYTCNQSDDTLWYRLFSPPNILLTLTKIQIYDDVLYPMHLDTSDNDTS